MPMCRTRNAFVVQKLIEAGAIPIGKTNLDQFATGLNGTPVRPTARAVTAFDPAYISGGSSSGSAVVLGCARLLQLLARHRYRRLRSSAGRLQQSGWSQANLWLAFGQRRGAGLSFARHDFDLRADGRGCRNRDHGGGMLSMPATQFFTPRPKPHDFDFGSAPSSFRFGVPRTDHATRSLATPKPAAPVLAAAVARICKIWAAK